MNFSTNDPRLIVLEPGFRDYDALSRTNATIIDLAAPNVRIFNSGSTIANGKQDYFPLGTLQSTLSVGVFTDKSSLSHQSEAIYGLAENEFRTPSTQLESGGKL